MSGPKAFSMRKAMSGVRADFLWSKSDNVARRTLRISAAFFTVRPSSSMISVLIRSRANVSNRDYFRYCSSVTCSIQSTTFPLSFS